MIFADTGFFFALFSERDRHHARVIEILETFGDRRLPDPHRGAAAAIRL